MSFRDIAHAISYKALYTVWAPHRSRYVTCRPPLVSKRLSRLLDRVTHTVCLVFSAPWRLSRRRRRLALGGSLPKGSRFYPVSCKVCGNVCSSSALLGGCSDYSGDYGSMFCNICMAPERLLEE